MRNDQLLEYRRTALVNALTGPDIPEGDRVGSRPTAVHDSEALNQGTRLLSVAGDRNSLIEYGPDLDYE